MFTTSKKAMHTVKGLAITSLLLASEVAVASGDPFAAATTKTNQLNTYLTGGIALAVTTIVISIAGFAQLMNKLSKEHAIRIITGALIIGGSATIAGFFFG